MSFVWFLLGLMVGGIIGFVIMCILQANHSSGYELKLHENEENVHRK